MIRCSAFRFFLVTSPPPRWMLVALLLVTSSGCTTLWLNPGDVDSAYGPILLLQMFAASSGFTYAAAGGHFDPVLVCGRSRWRVGLSSFAAAATPGVCAWMVVAIWGALLGEAARAMSAHRFAAIWIASCLAWGLGVVLPRLAAGAAWTMVLLALALSRGPLADALLVVRDAPQAPLQILGASGACLTCPFLLLGEFPGATNALVLGLDCCIATILVFVAAWYLSRRDYALTEPA